MKKHIKYFSIFTLGILVGLLVLGLSIRTAVSNTGNDEFHEHANFAVYLNGGMLDFSDDKYMHFSSCAYGEQSHEDEIQFSPKEKIHLHDNNGGTIHVHKEGLTYSDFFEGISMKLGSDYFVDDKGNRYETNSTNKLKFYKNGQEIEDIGSEEVRNLDQVLITYHQSNRSESALNSELLSVPNDACISSGVCRQRGIPVAENCGKVKQNPWILNMLDINLD